MTHAELPVAQGATPLRLFVSYGHDSAEDARVLKEDLENRGYQVWMDLDRLKPGADWDSRIEEGLLHADRVLLLMTPYAVRRRNPIDPESSDGYCLNEIAKALQCRKEIVPVMLEGVDEGPPTSICRLQWLDMTDCRPLADRTDKYCARLEQLVDAIEAGSVPAEGELGRLLKLLKPADFKLELRRHLGRYHRRQSLEVQLDAWLADENGQPILWVVGRPGVGKSAFAVNVCHRRGDAFHMCIRGYTEQNDPRSVLTGIAFQLATHLPEYQRRLSRLANLEDELRKGAAEIFDNLVLAPLSTHEFPAPGRTILVVIDGLDEATVAGRNELAQLIVRRAPQLPSWIRFVVTGREEQELIGALRSQPRLRLSADDTENLAVIRAYFVENLQQLGVRLGEDQLESLVAKSEGVFLWASHVVEALRKGERSITDIPQLPAGLEAWYLSDFERRFDDVTVYQRDLKPLLEVVASQRAPLPLSVLQAALGISLAELSRRIGRLGSLFPVREETSGERTIQPAHASLRDWLLGIDESTFVPIAGAYALDEVHGNKLLADDGWNVYQRGALAGSHYHFDFLPEHLAASSQDERLGVLLADLDLLLLAFETGRKYEWMRHWLRTGRDPVHELSQALERRNAAGVDRERQAKWAGAIGAFLRDLGLTADALPFLERSIQLRSDDSGDSSPELAASLRDLAELHRLQKNFEKALELHQRSLAIFQQHLGPRNAQVATAYHDLSMLHRDQGNYAEALSYNQRALTLRESIEPVDYRGLADCVNNMGVLLWEKSGSPHAEAYYRRALEIGAKHWPADDPQTATFLHNIGQLKKGDAGDVDLDYLRRALKVFAATFVAHHRDVQTCRRTLASHLEARGHYEEARALRTAVLDNTIAASGADSGAAADARRALELCRRRQRDLVARILQTCAEIEHSARPGNPREGDLRKRALEAVHDLAQRVRGKGAGKAGSSAGRSGSVPAAGPLADALFQFGAYLQDYGYDAAALQLLTLAHAAAEGHGEDRSVLLRIVTRLGALHARRKEYARAGAYESQRLELLLGRMPAASRQAADCCRNQVSLCFAVDDHRAALEHARRALRIVEQARGRGSAEAAEVRASMGEQLNQCAMALKNEQANFVAAEPYYRLALEIEPGQPTYLGNLALLLTSGLDRHDEAERLYGSALAASRSDANLLANYAFFLHHVRRDVEGARRLYEEALRLPPTLANACCNYAALLITVGECRRAAEMLELARSLPRDRHADPRILYVRAILELVEGRDATFYWGQLRFLFEAGSLHAPWRASQFFAYIEQALSGGDLSLARAMARALSEREYLEQMRKTPEWQSSSFVPMDESWPQAVVA
jgi:tetratricopeptide (TPR) repeat protein